jgi:hypothetical protein
MTRIHVTGALLGHPVTATWEDGELTAPQPYKAITENLPARRHRVQIAGVTNTIATLAADARPIDVVATLIAELDDGYRVTTDADLVQDLPEDAIA